MVPYSIRSGYISTITVNIFNEFKRLFDILEDYEDPEVVTCHAICRMFALLDDRVKCVDGYFYKVGHEHSWLNMGNGIIADMYPIASSNPFMVDASHWMVPWNKLYIPEPTLLDHNLERKSQQDVIALKLFKSIENRYHRY